ncbi:MAG: LamG domain-containing protein [Opitutaceae bacterium]|nr:LamG domain-containing protein [Opitutaceae bacterium]
MIASSPRLLARALRLTVFGLVASFPLAAFAQTSKPTSAEQVERLIGSAQLGRPPVLWFGSDPKINLGSGPAGWTADSGGQLAARSPDAWGRQGAAFGLAAEAKGGVAVSGSTTLGPHKGPINPKSGTVLFFFRPGENSAPPMLLFSRADWGNPNYLSLRINAVGGRWELTLAVADTRASAKATQANFATLQPGAWTFVALAWQENAGLCRFRYWAGDLATGELTEGEHDTTPLDPTPGIFTIAGRRADNIAKYGTAPLLFSGGLLHHFAIYDDALSEDAVKRIYLAACLR